LCFGLCHDLTIALQHFRDWLDIRPLYIVETQQGSIAQQAQRVSRVDKWPQTLAHAVNEYKVEAGPAMRQSEKSLLACESEMSNL
jgi:hypothetical protein